MALTHGLHRRWEWDWPREWPRRISWLPSVSQPFSYYSLVSSTNFFIVSSDKVRLYLLTFGLSVNESDSETGDSWQWIGKPNPEPGTDLAWPWIRAHLANQFWRASTATWRKPRFRWLPFIVSTSHHFWCYSYLRSAFDWSHEADEAHYLCFRWTVLKQTFWFHDLPAIIVSSFFATMYWKFIKNNRSGHLWSMHRKLSRDPSMLTLNKGSYQRSYFCQQVTIEGCVKINWIESPVRPRTKKKKKKKKKELNSGLNLARAVVHQF